MTTKIKSLVFGYVRDNYHLYVPEVIVKACILFYDPEIMIKFKGNDLKKFLQAPNGHKFEKKIKFNQYLSFVLQICPNPRKTVKPTAFVSLQLAGYMTERVDYYAVSFEISCIETQTFVHTFYKMRQGMNNEPRGSSLALSLSECKKQKKLTFKFVIHSLELKYKNESDANKQDLVFYPSLKARLMKQETCLNWNIDIERFRNCAAKQTFYSEVKDNWNLVCVPKGMNHANPDNCYLALLAICLGSWPLDVSKIVLGVTTKIHMDFDDNIDKEEAEFTVGDYNERKLALVRKYYFDWEKIGKMTINATLIIKGLYDMDDNEISVENWKDHNVELNAK